MSRILVIEPRNILRQAIGLALFPDHEVQMAAWLSDSHATVAQEFDLVIVDAAASAFEGNRGRSRQYGSTIPERAKRRPVTSLWYLLGRFRRKACNQL